MQDTEGRVFAWRGETFGMVSADKIAPVLKDAVVATEDKRFYSHFGISPRGIASAIKIPPLAMNGITCDTPVSRYCLYRCRCSFISDSIL